jgi:ribosomal-protein-alanine N-acetyltransferase
MTPGTACRARCRGKTGDLLAAGCHDLRVISLELVPAASMEAMLEDDLSTASEVAGRQLPRFFLEEKWLWRVRLAQVRTSPQDAPWLVRSAVDYPGGEVVGHAGFHGRPDADGMVEVGYTVVPEHRGHGHAHEVLAALVEEARTSGDVRVVRATISPDNTASLAVARGAGFAHVGEQWDGEDGLELVFEKLLERSPAGD